MVAMLKAQGNQDAAQKIRLKIPWKYMVARQEMSYRDVRNWLARAMHSALTAAIAATGAIPKDSDTPGRQMERLQHLCPGEDLSTRTEMEHYGKEELPEGAGEEEFASMAFQDLEKIRELALRLRRRNGRKGQKQNREKPAGSRGIHSGGGAGQPRADHAQGRGDAEAGDEGREGRPAGDPSPSRSQADPGEARPPA